MNHVSDFTWDRLHAGQLSAPLVAAARLHAAGCARCAARDAAIVAELARFAVPLRARRARWWLAAPALAAAAALILVLRPPPPGERSKGGFAVTAFAGRAGDAVPLGAGDAVYSGDRLQLTYSAAQPGHLAVLALDGAGQTNVYFPTDGTTTWPAAPGHALPLPSSTELDGVLGAERLWIVFCADPQPLAPMLAELRAHGLAAAPPTGCAVQRLTLAKAAR